MAQNLTSLAGSLSAAVDVARDVANEDAAADDTAFMAPRATVDFSAYVALVVRR